MRIPFSLLVAAAASFSVVGCSSNDDDHAMAESEDELAAYVDAEPEATANDENPWITKAEPYDTSSWETTEAEFIANDGQRPAARAEPVEVEEVVEVVETPPAVRQPVAAAPADAINAVCPVAGAPIGASMSRLTYKGSTIAFCCDNCKGKFQTWDEAARDRWLMAELRSR